VRLRSPFLDRYSSWRAIGTSIWLVLLVLSMMPVAYAQPQAASLHGGRPTTQNEIADADRTIQTFAASRSVGDLRNAVAELEKLSFGQNPGPDEMKPDERLAKLWLRLFSVVDSTMTNVSKGLKVPTTVVGPPPSGPGEPSYPPGVSPSEIKDTVEREKYESAIAENKKRIEENTYYAEVRNINDKASAEFWTWSGPRYEKSAEARRKMLQDAKALGLSPERIEKVREAVGASK
jgi:hypothetical protein